MNTAIAHLREHTFDLIHDGQTIFRTLMLALAFPGMIRKLQTVPLTISFSRTHFILQPLLTLLDLETCFYIHSTDDALKEQVSRYIEINTGSSAETIENANFILCLEPSLNGQFKRLKRGTLKDPSDSATVFYLTEDINKFERVGASYFSMSGPGIRERQWVSVKGIASKELEEWKAARREYPMGIDIYLVSEKGDVIGIPRSVSIHQ